MKKSRATTVAAAAIVALTLAACSSTGASNPGASSSPAAPASTAAGSSSAGQPASSAASPASSAPGAPSSAVTSTPADNGASVCQGTPVPGGTLVAARQNQTLSLSPYKTPGGWGDGEAINLIYEGLVRMDPSGKTSDIVPAIADKWSVAPDGLSYDFHIRDNAKFSNGDAVTAQDVKFTLDMWADPKQDQWAAFAAGYKSTDVIDASNVRVNLTEVTGGFLYQLAMVAAVIMPEKLVKAQGAAFFEKPVGSGPFMLDSWQKGSSITFVKNPNYWQAGQPRLDKVVFNFITDDNTRILALKGGQAQSIDSVPWNQVAALQQTQGIAVDAFAIPSWILLSVNHQKPQFKDVNVRQALNLSIDRDTINKKIYQGLGTIPNSFLPKLHYDGDDAAVPPFAFDVAKAKSLMAGSSFASGFKATLEFPSGSTAFQALAVVLQAEWAEIGVTVELRPEDQATLSKNFTGGTYDIMLPYALAASDVPIPDEFATFYGIPGTTNGFYTWWSDPAIEAMVKQFIHTADDATRAQQWPKIQAAMAQQLPALNVLDLPLVKARATNVCDDVTNPIGYDTLMTAWIAK